MVARPAAPATIAGQSPAANAAPPAGCGPGSRTCRGPERAQGSLNTRTAQPRAIDRTDTNAARRAHARAIVHLPRTHVRCELASRGAFDGSRRAHAARTPARDLERFVGR